MKIRLAVAVAFLLFIERPAASAEVQVAVASNFERPMRRIAEQFAADTGHQALISTGATGAFFAQIEHGAPFEVFLAADSKTPGRLETDGFTVAGSRFVYALGALVLWSTRPGYVDGAGAVLRTGDFRHLAIANPQLAPYGAAAEETLTSLKLLDALRPRLVQGETIAQTHQFVASGNAELGFVARSQVDAPDTPKTGSYWVVPAGLYSPIRQEAVLLRKGANNPAARALCEYLTRPKVRDMIRSYGYDLPALTAP
jgi:molybdate transport system substrate-binding protein